MNKIKILPKYYYLSLIIFVNNLLYSKQEYYIYNMEISKEKKTLEEFHINNDNSCKWIPSLLYPLPIVDQKNAINANKIDPEFSFNYNNPSIQYDTAFSFFLHNFSFINNQNDSYLGKPKSSRLVDVCYLGLCYKNLEASQLPETYILINQLKNNKAIKKKIFSFDKWDLNHNVFIKSTLYLGDFHKDFQLVDENGIIGTCKTNKDDIYWGCIFDQMSFNGNSINLKNDSFKYKIYFSSESHKIIFPKKFKLNFDILTNEKCQNNDTSIEENERYLFCDDFFNEEGYASLQLVNDNMNITFQIDNINRFTKGNDEKTKSRILYKDYDFFIFPLIMFKNFHVQFNGENGEISFYTNDTSILHVKNQEKKKDKGKSKGFIAFIIILVIVLVLGFFYLVFWFIKRRRSSVEKDINKYNKFEDNDNFQDINEKRIF